MFSQRKKIILCILFAALLACAVMLISGCDNSGNDSETTITETTTNIEVTDMTTASEETTAEETKAEITTQEETTPAFDPVPANFTEDDLANHKEIPLFADMEVPFYSEKIGLLPTIAAYLVDDSPACVLIFPGGGYFQRTDGAEGIEIAEAYNAAGISAFLVRYRYDQAGMTGTVTYDRHAIMADAQRSVQFVRYYADEFHIDRDKVAVCGFSAGGHLAMVISEHTDELYEGAESSAIGQCDSHPDALVLGYPLVNMKNAFYTVPNIFLNQDRTNKDAIAKYSYSYKLEALPATFMFAYKNDDMVAVKINEQKMAKDMEEAGMKVECHIFNDGAHGVGLGKQYPEFSTWFDLSVKFLDDLFGLKASN